MTRGIKGCMLPSLEARVRVIQLSPIQTGLAGHRHTRFLMFPASYSHAPVPFDFHLWVRLMTQRSPSSVIIFVN